MKPIHFLPPAVAVAICGIWISSQRQSIATLESQSSLLRKEIAARLANDHSGGAASPTPASSSAAPKGARPRDWQKIAAQLTAARKSGTMEYIREMNHLKERLMAMDKEELAVAFGEIASLGLSDDARQAMETMIIEFLVEKDPAFALERCIGLMNVRNSWHFAHGLRKWAMNDPAAAGTWFDRQVATGVFDSKSLDGRSQPRMRFEGSLINALLANHPEDATRRLAALPKDQRADILGYHVTNALKSESEAAYAKLVRQSLPENESLKIIALLLSRAAFSSDAYTAATECMDRIGATPAERDTGVEDIAERHFGFLSEMRDISKEDIDGFRAWAATQAHDKVNLATGKALAGSLNGKMDFSEAAGLALDYHAGGGGDELLVPLLQHWSASHNKEQARELAGKISDEALRAKYLQHYN